ncbi:MAG: tetratricopeptide repeat protein [Lachnospiraceae bacterium]
MKVKIDTREFYRTLDRMYEKKEIRCAELYMLETLLKAGKLGDLEGVIAVCNELGGLYRAMRRIDEAQWAYEKVIDGLQGMGMKETENYASALINQGNVYIAKRAYDKAYEVECQAFELLERIGGQAYQKAALYNNMSASLRELGRLKEAEDMAMYALGIVEKLPECIAEEAVSYTNLGQAQAKSMTYPEARKSLARALELFQNLSGDKDIHYAAAVYAMAEVEEAEGHHEKAEQGYIRAAELIKRDFGYTGDYEQIQNKLKNLREIRKKSENPGKKVSGQ